ncbi:hypothetical protein AOQ72_12575 [Bradyrhizobium yuanmingense]|uniref:Uncharacterized protein n=1 Tax=Bradyrhizobium yuanmingense TaxID=108015 RepID=A0A0R3CNQ9_9BRAD|nr:hypothetical protein AOQ72_12575 [Bradyrhizobium yuanmingense]
MGLAYYNYHQDRSEAARRVLETVRSMRMVFEGRGAADHGGLPLPRGVVCTVTCTLEETL